MPQAATRHPTEEEIQPPAGRAYHNDGASMWLGPNARNLRGCGVCAGAVRSACLC